MAGNEIIVASPESAEAVETDTPVVVTSMAKPVRVGFAIFFLVFGVFGTWAAVAPLGGHAMAPGVVTVKSYSQIVQHLEGGIIDEINVENGDFVDAGEQLLVMDNTQSLAQLEIVNSQFVALKTAESRLLAERDKLDQVVFADELQTGASNLREENIRAEMDAQNQIFRARKAALEGGIEVLQQRIVQLQSKLVGLGGLKDSKEELAISYADELSDVRELLEQGFSDITKLRSLERSLAGLNGEAAELTANIASTEIEIGEARLQILQQQREFHNQVVNSLGETQTSLNNVRERTIALQDIVSRTVVRAPVAGIVNGMQFHTVGGVIGPGNPIADIVPQSVELIVEGRVSPTDIDRVTQGQKAIIRFSSFGNSVPTIFGTVLNISADSIVDQNTGLSYYQVRIEVTPEGMEELGDLELLPGMPAEVFIATGSRTLLQYLFKPFSNAMARSFNED